MFTAENLHVLATVYNEESFLRYSIQSYLPYVKTVTIVEGAYKETYALGATLRSKDKTLQIAESFLGRNSKVQLIEANEKSDAQQRNIGLDLIKSKSNPGDWLLIVDGDEVYNPITIRMIHALTKKMEFSEARAAYFKSLTFVNDFNHYCDQYFPRLFKITPNCSFVNDNFMEWRDRSSWQYPYVIRANNIEFFHYSFCKGKERFLLKKKWWQTRFEKEFNYSWSIDDDGKINDTQHTIKEYRGAHPKVMEDHPMYKSMANQAKSA